jgi:hypothetical protein
MIALSKSKFVVGQMLLLDLNIMAVNCNENAESPLMQLPILDTCTGA